MEIDTVYHYVFRFGLFTTVETTVVGSQIKELMVDASSDNDAFRKAIKRNIALDPKKISYTRREDENGLIIFEHKNIKLVKV